MANFIKKIMPHRHPPDMSLGLNHLRKLFAEFRHPNRKASQEEQEEKLYTMIPLFCKTFGEVPSSEMMEKFGDILQFCSHLSKLMVTEIRRRASNQSTEAASCAIVRFLEINSSEEASNGWMLLTALNLLSSGGQALIDCMTAASLPSTLVKCLYLFFDLPEISDGDKVEPGCNFSHRERRILLQKVFVQVLVRLCNFSSPAEELARKDDLSLLFSAITSWCPNHNAVWRKSAGDVLVPLSRHGLTSNVVKYIHDKGCVRHCVENMQRIQELSPIEQVEMFVTVFCFLKDSSEVSQILMEDFKSCQGYNYLCEFLLRLELDTCTESQQALRNLLLLVGSLTTCGYLELKPNQASSGSLYQMPGFSLPQPAGKGVSVRNIHAFQVLQSIFIKASSSFLCNTILEVINSIYHQDNANYFILEPQHTLSQFVEKIYQKPQNVQEKFFELLEFIVYDLNFVPCKELISISILIKSDHSTQCNILCLKSLLNILQAHSIYKDVFREVGMLEVMVTCLHRYAALLRLPESEDVEPETVAADQQELGFLVIECLTTLLSGNSKNADVFRECGGARCSHNMIPHSQCRKQILNIIQQLVLSPGGDDDMGTLLGQMHSSPVLSLQLKTHILKSLLNVLRESHRTRNVFRKVGGFVYVMSVLVSMEGCLCDPPNVPWDQVRRQDVLSMLKTVFSTLTVAMRYEPANAKFFETEVRYDSLTEAVRLLGCFSSTIDIQPSGDVVETEQHRLMFEDIFVNMPDSKTYEDIPMTQLSACVMLKYLYNMALDIFDKPAASQQKSDSPSIKRLTMFKENSTSPQSSPKQKRASTGSITVSPHTHVDQIIVHPGAVLSLFHLLPAIEYDDDNKLSLSLQINTAELLKSLLHTERNQQIMCEYGYPHELLSHGYIALADETHPLHPALRSMFERLASQSLTPRDLRDFLRLGSPLNCRPMDDAYNELSSNSWSTNFPISRASSVEERKTPLEVERKLKTAGEAVPLTRVKCLVSMTTPKDARMHGSAVTPSFIEFDMTAEGFGCLYLPSIAPQGPPTPSVVSGVVGGSDPIVIGGIGTGERVFPPQSGMTFSTWFCVDKFSSMADPHPVRLLTLVRNLQGREENLICLSVIMTSRERALIVSTEEHLLPNTVTGTEIDEELSLNDNRVRFWYPELTQEGQWHHLVLIFHRAGIMKNSSVSLFVDGDHVNTQKLHYVSPNLGVGGTASPTAFTSVFSYIGSPPQVRRNSKLTWRQGPCHLMEDIVSTNVIRNIYNLGPTYIGSFQSPNMDDGEFQGSFIGEEKMMFGVHAHAVLQMTVAKIRKAYNKIDSKSIAKQLAMSAHDNATPIRILPNSAGHMNGPARSLGAILIGYLGVRTFCPKAVAKMLENVGGASALLGLIAMATDVEELYAAVKALVCVVKSNKNILKDMDRIQGYQTLAMLYKKKQHLLNSHILHLTFSLIGTVDSGKESSVIPNKKAFEDLLCDLEVWHEAPFDLQKSLYEHFFELLTESSDQTSNFQLMRDIGLVSRLLHILKDNKLTVASIDTITSVIHVLLQSPSDSHSLLRFGQFIVSTLPQMSASEKNLVLNGIKVPCGESSENDISLSDDDQVSSYTIKLRNICLNVIHKLIIYTENDGPTFNIQMCEEIQKVLGFDWLLLFVQGHIHSSTVVKASLILLTILQNQAATQKFREGSLGGGWLKGTEPVLKQHVGVMLGLNIGTSNKGHKRALNREVCQVPGFNVLQWLLPKHANVPDLYFILMAMLLGQQIKSLPTDVQLNLDAVWTVIFGVPASKPVSAIAKEKQTELCPDAALVLLALIRHMLNQDSEQKSSLWLQEYPVTLMQFLLFLYHNQPDFISLSTTPEFISGLVATLFPYTNVNTESKVTTPQEEYVPFPEVEGYVHVKAPETTQTNVLSDHSAKKFVIDFLRTIILDSFSQQSSPKPVLDVVLDASPDNASRLQRHEFQTEIMKTMMEHLVAADVLLGEQAALPIATGGSYVNMANNVFYFASRVVDKLWQSVFMRESKEVFGFISKLIAQARRKASGVSLDLIYKSLNRTILYQLSRPLSNVASSTGVLDALHKLTSNRSLVFGPNNYDTEFLICLCYCLLQLTDDPERGSNDLLGGQAIKTTWHINFEEADPYDFVLEGTGVPEGHLLVCKASKRVWEELYAHKKPSLEEVFKTQLNNIDSTSTDFTSPDLNTVRGLIQESASRVWVQYVENERKCNVSYADRIPAQIQSKIAKMGSVVWKMSLRKKGKDLPLKSSPSTNVHMTDYISWTLTHMAVVRDLVQLQYQQYLQGNEHMERYLVEEWTQSERELLREKGLWGPYLGSRFDKWMLDMTEGPCRMRKKMVANDIFFSHYPYRPDMENSPLKYKVAMCFDSRGYYERYLPKTLIGLGNETLPIQIGTNINNNIDNEGTEERSPEDILPKLVPRKSDQKSTDNDEDLEEPSTTDNNTETEKSDGPIEGQGDQIDSRAESQTDVQTNNKSDNNQAIFRILGEGEKITNIFRCARIQGLDTAEGLLLFGKEYFYIIDGLTMLKSREIRDIDSLPIDLHDPIIPSKGSCAQKRTNSKFAYDDIKEVHKRRYLLQPIAVEVFSSDGRNYLLAFPRKLRNKVYAKFLSVATEMTDAQQSVSGQKVGARIEAGSGLISSLIGEKSVTQRWERGEINNFQYLMHLNSLAGRSYNDLMQYPVFPWVVADYDSEELDLYSESTFRDMSKPMGAQTADRLKQFRKRYNDWDDPQGETPPYHYGTHYSSAMIVASYLVRMEPFTQHFLKLQGGHFDLADRMFHSIREGWLSASKNNMADVKELIPEFFYLPEFLVNSNNFDLGAKQSGVQLDSVILPQWAKGDPREFIRGHREALECDFVSAHIHEWIDLIFGYKQQGQPAVDAVNVFHHLFYEGNVDIYSIDDPLKKNATIGFINNFGQIPKQLFKKAHPQKKLALRLGDAVPMGPLPANANDKLFFHNVDNLRPTKQAIKELKGEVGQIIHHDSKYVLAVEQNKVLIPPQYNKYLSWGFSDLSVRIGNYESEKALHVFENLDNGEILCSSCPNAKTFITGGTSTVVNVWELKPKSKKVCLKQPLYGHTETVTCLASSQAYNVIVSGSRDRTCIIWDLSRFVHVRQLRGHAAPVAAVCINELTGDIATCAGTYLYVWSINGEEIACVNTAPTRSQQILCLAMSQILEWDNRNVILTGSSDGVVRMWSVEYVQVPIEEKSVKEILTENNDATSKNTEGAVSNPTSILARQVSCDSYILQQNNAREHLKDFREPNLVEMGSSLDSESHMTTYMAGSKDKARISGNMDREESVNSVTSNDDAMHDDQHSIKSADLSIDAAVEAEEEMIQSNISDTQIPSQSEPNLNLLNDVGSYDRSRSHPDLKSGDLEKPADLGRSGSSEFEIISDKEVKNSPKTVEDILKKYKPRTRHTLRDGFKWQRQLVFRSKLTMHTAFERKDNKDPAAVTAIAISKDHKTVYVGDVKGRIFSWTVSDQPGRVVADHWMKDEVADSCKCGVKFSFSERKHHCRNCGDVFCSKCSRYETEIRRLMILRPVRVCKACYKSLKGDKSVVDVNRS